MFQHNLIEIIIGFIIYDLLQFSCQLFVLICNIGNQSQGLALVANVEAG